MYRDETKNLVNLVRIVVRESSEYDRFQIGDFSIGSFVFCKNATSNSEFISNENCECFCLIYPLGGVTTEPDNDKWVFNELLTPRRITNINTFTIGIKKTFCGYNSSNQPIYYTLSSYDILFFRIS